MINDEAGKDTEGLPTRDKALHAYRRMGLDIDSILEAAEAVFEDSINEEKEIGTSSASDSHMMLSGIVFSLARLAGEQAKELNSVKLNMSKSLMNISNRLITGI